MRIFIELTILISRLVSVSVGEDECYMNKVLLVWICLKKNHFLYKKLFKKNIFDKIF